MAGATDVETDLDDRPAGSIATALIRFAHRLRDAGVPVSMVETLDCADALGHVDVLDRSVLKATLATTLVKRTEHRAAFDALFEAWFAVRHDPVEAETTLDRQGDELGAASEASSDTAADAMPSTEFLEMLLQALRSGDESVLRVLAQQAVSLFGGMDGEVSSSERYYLYRVMRQLELAELLRRAMLMERGESDDLSRLDERLLRDEHLQRMEEFRELIAQEIRRALVERRREGAAAMHGIGEPPIEDVDFLDASPTELRRMREAIRPLAQKLAARIARRRRFRRRGRLDVRRTLRRSLSAGGVPLDPAFRHPRASKPELYLLCDISGSVSEFARFTMSLLHAVSAEFSRIRLFAFVDGIDEVTELMDRSGHELAPRNLLYGTKVIFGDGHSDYGNVFRRFWHLYGYADLDPRTTVIITGDARNNFRDPGLEAFRMIAERARKVYWLNPEPRQDWNTSDSIMDVYAGGCHAVFETRNLAQLAEFVGQIV
ncbi:MAG: VWA domain-containing protein [Actinomycetota bacterium]